MADDRNAKQSDVDAGEPLPAEATAVLAEWATSDPPAGFVDRVIAAARQGQAAPPPARRWRPIRTVVVAAVALAASVATSALLLGGGGSSEEGARVVKARETIVLGRRGVAVAEAGTELTWTLSAAGSAEVHQSRGEVFYRIERGGPFVVETPFGRVMVRGTCFRVEVLDMSLSRQAWISGAVGAALAATIVIAVYEGQVRVVNARGQADARAGERIALGAGAAPTKITSPTTVAAIEPPPPESASLQELLRRDQSHRGEIALLRARLNTLENASGAPEASIASDHRTGKRKIVDLSQEELAAMAKDCEIRFDVPGYGIEPRLMTDKLAQAANLSADDRTSYNQTVRKENDQFMAAMRSLYLELTGSDAGDMDVHALFMEILHKSPSADVEVARKRLAEERAGLLPPPADSRNQSVVERLFRLETSAGNTLEQLLAAELGPDKAHQIRTSGWAGGDDNILSGCPD